MDRFQGPAEGTWTKHYPELGTEPVSFESASSPEFDEIEREPFWPVGAYVEADVLRGGRCIMRTATED